MVQAAGDLADGLVDLLLGLLLELLRLELTLPTTSCTVSDPGRPLLPTVWPTEPTPE